MSKTASQVYKRNLSIAKMRAEGKSQKDIAKVMGISQPAVSYALQDPEIKELLTNVNKYLTSYATAIEPELIRLCFDEDKSIRLRAIGDYNKIIGITPSHTPSIFINNLYQDNRQQIITSDVIELLNKHTATMTEDTPLEIESKVHHVVDIETDNE